MPYKKRFHGIREDQDVLILRNKDLGDTDLEDVAKALRGSRVTYLGLEENTIGVKGIQHLTEILRSTQISRLNLKSNHIGDEGIKHLANNLKGSQVVDLHLGSNDIGPVGIQYLADVLPHLHQIRKIYLTGNHIGDQGLKSLSEVLPESSVKFIDLFQNNVTTDSIESLQFIMNQTDIKICIDVYCKNIADRYIRINRYSNGISLSDIVIGNDGALCIQECFKNIPINYLAFGSFSLHKLEVGAQYLSDAFHGIKIGQVQLHPSLIFQTNSIRHLIKALKDTRVERLYMGNKKPDPARYIADFLKEINVFELNLQDCDVEDESMKYLGPALKDSTVLHLKLRKNKITATGAKYLAEILRDTQIVYLDLSENMLKDEGLKYLADGLEFSQVTNINFSRNGHTDSGILFADNVCARQRDRVKKICDLFQTIVWENPVTDEFEFRVPANIIDIDQYVSLTKALIQNPNVKAHLFYLYCKAKDGTSNIFDFDKYDKISKFVSTLPQIFNRFVNNHVLNLLEFSNVVSLVGVVKEFDQLNQTAIVENLLLHRELFYVDNNFEILHPYVYKMLDKYNMVLYQTELEPYKRNKIIRYYKDNLEFSEAQDVIDLLTKQINHFTGLY